VPLKRLPRIMLSTLTSQAMAASDSRYSASKVRVCVNVRLMWFMSRMCQVCDRHCLSECLLWVRMCVVCVCVWASLLWQFRTVVTELEAMGVLGGDPEVGVKASYPLHSASAHVFRPPALTYTHTRAHTHTHTGEPAPEGPVEAGRWPDPLRAVRPLPPAQQGPPSLN
jgi:hypothetical protein